MFYVLFVYDYVALLHCFVHMLQVFVSGVCGQYTEVIIRKINRGCALSGTLVAVYGHHCLSYIGLRDLLVVSNTGTYCSGDNVGTV